MNEIETKLRLRFEMLARELTAAQAHIHLAQGLQDSIAEFQMEMNEARLFWSQTIQAHRTAAMASLCRVFDQHGASSNLAELLIEIKRNISAFDPEKFVERYQGNPLRPSTNNARRPSQQQLESDITFCRESPDVRTLINWRNEAFSHTNKRVTFGTLKLTESDPLHIEALKRLMIKGFEILNHYSTLFQGSDYGGFWEDVLDDYKVVLEALRSGAKR